jgi:hypothetical protein
MRPPVFLALFLFALAARGADAPASDTDSIAAAKKDLAAIKTPGDPQDATSALPSLDLKDIGPVPGLPSLAPAEKDPSLDPAKKKKGTGNWLVDAMEKNSDHSQASRSREKDDILKGDPDLLRAEEKPDVLDEKDPKALDEAREKAASKEVAETAYNPLDSFMSGWISTRDHDLLLPSSKGEGVAGAELSKARVEALPGLDGVPTGSAENLLPSPDSAAPGELRGPNPYMALLDTSSAPSIRTFSPVELPGLGPEALLDASHGLSSGVDPRPIDTPRGAVPDFAQPGDDDKYFKQMKRF